MDDESVKIEQEECEEEYVLLDLEALAGKVDIPSNAPYVLTGLDTLNPVLTIDGKIQLIGEYQETIGTGFAFSENEVTIGPNHAPKKQVEPVATLHKILKFRLLLEDDGLDTTAQPT